MWHRECEQNIHVQQSQGLGLGGKSWRPYQGQGLDFSLKAKAKNWGAKAKAKTLSSKAKAKIKTFMRCPQGSSRPRPGLEDNKTAWISKQKLTTRIYVEAHICCTCLDVITIWAAYIAGTYVTNPLLSPTIHTVRTSIAVYIQEKTITQH